ncbi:MAG TPA: copper transporter, partial [Streptosporangiaceae bacterium]|nr:copper transporter [Streptosporangiaceae bacterium]
MIDFRYHVVSIVAVFLALAIGIVLGSTELQGPAYNILNQTTAKLQGELDQARTQLSQSQAQASNGEAYAQAVEPAVLRDLLTGQRLLIVTEPGAQSSVVSGLTTAAGDAGASITGQINLQPKFFDTSDTTRDSLNQTTEDVAQQAGLTLASSGSFQQQAAQVIASQILVKSASSGSGQASNAGQPTSGQTASGQPSSGQASSGQASSSASGSDQATAAQTMLSAYANSGFLNTSGQPGTPATLVVVVTPQTAPSDGGADQLAQVLVPLVTEFAAKSSATVVAGSSGGSGSGSPIAVLRSNNVANQVSTIDDADFVSGQTVTM